ncbi:hypothetical protein AKJ09_05570 [Labilithrix luteola]|uniref:Uncharacterized protein n=1 Tax=Labilithrix luteola TaxID=1391654 RepID=A0A0K1PZU6_9BACT|nr:hypothetical protein AKJ09_05570 [Labilithrix luteola]
MSNRAARKELGARSSALDRRACVDEAPSRESASRHARHTGLNTCAAMSRP